MTPFMKLAMAAAFVAGVLSAPGVTPTQPKTTTLTDPPTSVNTALDLEDGYVLEDNCEISCHPWYRFCQTSPYNYKCDDRGRFKRGRSHSGCDRQCMCRCDSH